MESFSVCLWVDRNNINAPQERGRERRIMEPNNAECSQNNFFHLARTWFCAFSCMENVDFSNSLKTRAQQWGEKKAFVLWLLRWAALWAQSMENCFIQFHSKLTSCCSLLWLTGDNGRNSKTKAEKGEKFTWNEAEANQGQMDAESICQSRETRRGLAGRNANFFLLSSSPEIFSSNSILLFPRGDLLPQLGSWIILKLIPRTTSSDLIKMLFSPPQADSTIIHRRRPE